MAYFPRSFFAAGAFNRYFGAVGAAYQIDVPGVGPVTVFGPATLTPGPVVLTLPDEAGKAALGAPVLGYVLSVPGLGPVAQLAAPVVTLPDGTILEMVPVVPTALGAPEVNEPPYGMFFQFFR